ncbi:MAG TPA: flagellar basal body P-ring protein FlgI [Phycisphaerae bacterium]|jgi:flagellar P-ring protein precursor FlgI
MLSSRKKFLASALAIFAALMAPAHAFADVTARIADFTHLKGQRINRLVGMGLVTGLKGTGDGDQYLPTIRPLAQALQQFANPVMAADDLKDTKNVAVVLLETVVPENGAREGDRIDVQVTSFGAAKSLEGGRLLVSPLVYHDRAVEKIFAFASGPVRIINKDKPTTGVIDGGAVLEEDVLLAFVALGREMPFINRWIEPEQQYVTFVLDDAHAGWAMAAAMAEAINNELRLSADAERVALAVDSRNVVVLVPNFQRHDPTSWIRDIEVLAVLMPEGEARVTIDRQTGTIVVTGDARISPVIVSQRGLTVTVLNPQPPSEPTNPRVQTRTFIDLDTAGGERSAHVSDLLEALNRLQVPIEDRIAILTEINRIGKLHAKLMFKE